MNSGQSLIVERLANQPNGGCPVATIVVEFPESCKAIVEPVRALVELVEKLSHPASRKREFARVEAQVAESAARVECAAVGEVLRSLDAATERVACDGATWRSLGTDDKTYFTAAGPVTISRKLFRKEGEHNGPTLDVVGTRAGVVGDGWLPGAATAMAHLLQQGTAREAETTANRLGRLPYSRSSFERVGHAVGELYVQQRLDIEGELVEELVVPDEACSASIALDRVAVPMEEIQIDTDDDAKEHVVRVWHMAYVGALTLHDEDGRALHTVRYACMPDGDIAGIEQSLQGDLLHVLAQCSNLAVVKLADGAEEMRRRLDIITEGVADDAVDMVDFWHAVEKFGVAAQAIAKGRVGEQLLSQWRFWLLNCNDGAARVRRDLIQYRGIEAVDEAITYIDNQRHRMRYAQARAKGLPIGSGNVEASCKSIVRQRMVRGGARWKSEPGERVLHLRALAQSDRWDAGIAIALRPLRKWVRHVALYRLAFSA